MFHMTWRQRKQDSGDETFPKSVFAVEMGCRVHWVSLS